MQIIALLIGTMLLGKAAWSHIPSAPLVETEESSLSEAFKDFLDRFDRKLTKFSSKAQSFQRLTSTRTVQNELRKAFVSYDVLRLRTKQYQTGHTPRSEHLLREIIILINDVQKRIEDLEGLFEDLNEQLENEMFDKSQESSSSNEAHKILKTPILGEREVPWTKRKDSDNERKGIVRDRESHTVPPLPAAAPKEDFLDPEGP